GVAIAVLGLAWGLRSLGDVNDSSASWFSPVGWVQAVHAYGAQRWWPLLLPLLATVLLLVLAVALAGRRDVGAGLVPSRPGPARASALLSAPAGLALRQQRSALLWWSIGLFLGGLAFGSFGNEVTTMVADNPQLSAIFGAEDVANLVA